MDTVAMFSEVLQWLVLIAVVVGLLAVGHQVGMLQSRVGQPVAKPISQGPVHGTSVPPLEGRDIAGDIVSLQPDRRTLLVFLTPTCSTCADLVPAIRTVAHAERARMQTIVIALGSGPAAAEFAEAHSLITRDVRLMVSADLGDSFGVTATPFAVLIDEAGIMRASGITNHLEHLESVVYARWRRNGSDETSDDRDIRDLLAGNTAGAIAQRGGRSI